MKVKVKVEGLRECERALAELPKATGKNVLRRVAKGALEPMAVDARAKAPDDPRTTAPDLKQSIVVSEKRTPRAKQRIKGLFVKGRFRADASTGIQMAMGPSSGGGVLLYATHVEFGHADRGGGHVPAYPYMRPAWDGGAQRALDYVIDNLRNEIDRAAARLAKKRAKG